MQGLAHSHHISLLYSTISSHRDSVEKAHILGISIPFAFVRLAVFPLKLLKFFLDISQVALQVQRVAGIRSAEASEHGGLWDQTHASSDLGMSFDICRATCSVPASLQQLILIRHGIGQMPLAFFILNHIYVISVVIPLPSLALRLHNVRYETISRKHSDVIIAIEKSG
jgi:hypothetical protein